MRKGAGVARGRSTIGGWSDPLRLITSDPTVMSGQAVIVGTRVPVSVVLDCLADGMSAEQVVVEYPTLTAEGVRAAAAYGALLAREELVPLRGFE